MPAINDSFAKVLEVYQEIQSDVSSSGAPNSKLALEKKVGIIKGYLEQDFSKLVLDTANLSTLRKKSWSEIKITLRSFNEIKNSDAALKSVLKVCETAGCLRKFRKKYDRQTLEYQEFVDEFGCDVNGISKSGYTPLTLAVTNDLPEMISFLVGLKADPNKSDANGDSPLTLAVFLERKDLITMLVQLGAKVNASDENGISPLGKAVNVGREDLVKLLLSLQAKINKPDRNRYTPLSRAIKAKDLAMMELLVKLGADPNLDTTDLPLDDAIRTGDKGVVKLLCDLGADVNARDRQQLSAIYTAISRDSPEMVSYLQSLGAKNNVYCRSGRTPLTMASWKNTRLVKAIKKGGNQIPNEEMISDMIFVGHVFGLEGQVTLNNGEGGKIRVKLESIGESFALKHFLNLLDQFLLAYPHQFQKKIANKLLAAFRTTIPVTSAGEDASLKRVKAGLPLVILGGTESHAIYFVVYDNKLVVCNRGSGCNKNACMFYKLNSTDVTIDLIKKLKTEFSNIDEFKKMIDDLKLEFLFGLNLKKQKVGNCVWANLKAALAALLFLLLSKKKWRSTYKRITCFMRETVLDVHLRKWRKTNVGFFDKIRTKLNGKKGLKNAKNLLALY